MVEAFRSKLLSRAGALPQTYEAAPSLQVAIESYYRACTANKSKKSQEADYKALGEFLHTLGNRLVDEIEDVDLGDYTTHCRDVKGWASSTTNRNLNTVRHFLGWAFRKGWTTYNLAGAVTRVSGPTRESRPLKQGDIDKIFAVATPALKLQLLLGVTWGLRRAEISSLSWNVINFESGRVQIGGTADFSTKSRKTKIVFLTPNLAVALKAHLAKQKAKNSWVFPNKAGTASIDPHVITRAWTRARNRAGVEDAKFHDLRATAGTAFAELGYGDATIAKLLGHSTERMARKYSNRVEETVLRQAVERAEQERFPVVVNGPSANLGQNTGRILKLVENSDDKV